MHNLYPPMHNLYPPMHNWHMYDAHTSHDGVVCGVVAGLSVDLHGPASYRTMSQILKNFLWGCCSGDGDANEEAGDDVEDNDDVFAASGQARMERRWGITRLRMRPQGQSGFSVGATGRAQWRIGDKGVRDPFSWQQHLW